MTATVFLPAVVLGAVLAAALPAHAQNGASGEGLGREELLQLQRARQELRKLTIPQQIRQKQLQLQQRQAVRQQQELTQQRLQKQNHRVHRQRIRAQQPEAESAAKLNGLIAGQASNAERVIQGLDDPERRRTIQGKQQEQGIKEKYPALKRYYDSLHRQQLRAQQDRIEGQ